MSNAAAMIETSPATVDLDHALLARVLDAAMTCAQTCTACADACLSEDMVADLAKCIRTDLDCADICATTVRVLSRHTAYDAGITKAQLAVCVQACRSCGDECEQHAGTHEHCRICAEACRACEQACRELLASVGG